MLAELLGRLLMGETIVIDRQENQKGELFPVRELRFYKGQWIEGELNCISASEYDFGSCRCNSHEPWAEWDIDRKRALELLRDKVSKEQEDAAQRAAEIEWLKSAIAELGRG